MDKIESLINHWEKRNIQGIYCQDRIKAREKVLEIIPVSSSVGISGSKTLEQLEVVKYLQVRGSPVFNQFRPGISREESMQLRNQGAQAEYYISSANAVSSLGEMVFFSALGHRISGIANAKNVIIVCGINKITQNLQESLKRARQYATPLNCQRLKFNTPCFKDGFCSYEICLFPEYKRMCCQVLVIEAEMSPQRLKVILVGESLGF